jgi:hypothetical protein
VAVPPKFLHTTGPTGRAVSVDASGRLIATLTPGDRFPFSFGEEGHALCVSSGGALCVTLEGSGVVIPGGSGIPIVTVPNTIKSLAAGSGVLLTVENDTITITSAGNGTSSLQMAYNAGQTIDQNLGPIEIDQQQNLVSLDIGKSATGAGDVITIDNLGTGADIVGTSGNWSIAPEGNLALVGDISATSGFFDGGIRISDTGTSDPFVGLEAPTAAFTSYTLRLPTADGTNGQAIITNGNGQLSFSTIAGGGGGSGVANSGVNLGNGVGIFAGLNGDNLEFKSLTAGSGVELTSTAEEITINALPEAKVMPLYGADTTASKVRQNDLPVLRFSNSQDRFVQWNSSVPPNYPNEASGVRVSLSYAGLTTSAFGNVQWETKIVPYTENVLSSDFGSVVQTNSFSKSWTANRLIKDTITVNNAGSGLSSGDYLLKISRLGSSDNYIGNIVLFNVVVEHLY